MDLSGFALQLLNGLASASTLFLVSAGLSLIFGVTRIVNFAHGSFYMLGIYLAYSLVQAWTGALGFWMSLLLAGLSVGLIGAAVEMVLIRRLYRSPELFQLLATFALVLVIKDAALDGDFGAFADMLPNRDFFRTDPVYKPFSGPTPLQEPLK